MQAISTLRDVDLAKLDLEVGYCPKHTSYSVTVADPDRNVFNMKSLHWTGVLWLTIKANLKTFTGRALHGVQGCWVSDVVHTSPIMCISRLCIGGRSNEWKPVCDCLLQCVAFICPTQDRSVMLKTVWWIPHALSSWLQTNTQNGAGNLHCQPSNHIKHQA